MYLESSVHECEPLGGDVQIQPHHHILAYIANTGAERMERFVKALGMVPYRWKKWGTLGYLRYRKPVAGRHSNR